MIRQLEVYLVALDPTVGSEMQKTRPCVVVSPDELNKYLRTVVIVPLTTKGILGISRIPCEFRGVPGQAALDHIRSVSRQRLVKRLGALSHTDGTAVLSGLQTLFSPE